MDLIKIFDSLKEADEYATINANAHSPNSPIIITPELLQALSSGKAVAIGVNGWECAEILIMDKDSVAMISSSGKKKATCPDCVWDGDPEGCNVDRDSKLCLINRKPISIKRSEK